MKNKVKKKHVLKALVLLLSFGMVLSVGATSFSAENITDGNSIVLPETGSSSSVASELPEEENVAESAESAVEEPAESLPNPTSVEEEPGDSAKEATIELFDLNDQIDVTPYLGVAAGDLRRVLDLKTLKDAGIYAGTLVLEGSTSNKVFAQITDTSTGEEDTGTYNILLGEYAGVEILPAAGTFNTFPSITNKPGVQNILPIYINAGVTDVSIDGNGQQITLNAIVDYPVPSGSNNFNRKLGIVVSGSGTVVQNMFLNDVVVTGYNQNYNGGYAYPVFIGAQLEALIDTFTVGNFEMNLANAQIGTLLGAAYLGGINNISLQGTLKVTGTPSITYHPKALFGSYQAYVGEMTIASTANIIIDKYSNRSGGSLIGISSGAYSGAFKDKISEKFVIENGSHITMTNMNLASNTSAIVSNGKYMDIGGKIEIDVTSTASTGGLSGSTIAGGKTGTMLVRASSDIRIYTSDYMGDPAIGKTGGELIVERGAKIDLSITKTYSIDVYFNVDVAFGGSRYGGSPTKILIGATLNKQTGAYEVVPTTDVSNQTEIRLKNYRALVYGSAVLNANVYAEVDKAAIPFYGSFSGNPVLVGGNYLVENNELNTLSYIPFTVNTASAYSTLNIQAKNQYGENLLAKLYVDAAAGQTFTYNVPAANFGVLPEYDYIIPVSFQSGISPQNKALYYPERGLYVQLQEPLPNGTVAVDGVLTLWFDLPVSSAENLGKEYQIFISQYNKSFIIPLNAENSEKFTFGSDIEGGNPRALYLHLDKIKTATGASLTANQSATVYFPSQSTTATLYENDSQLTLARKLVSYSASFLPVEPAMYVVSFDLNGATGSQIPSQTVRENTTAQNPGSPEWENYVFEGWFTQSGEKWDFDIDKVTGNLTLYANWAQQYTVIFDTNGGSTVDSQKLTSGSLVIQPSNPTKPEYLFDGWYKESSYTNLWNFAVETVVSDTTLYAKWVFNDSESSSSSSLPSSSTSYRVMYDVNWGGFGTTQMEDQTGYLAGQTVVLRNTIPSRSGYLFTAWNTSPNGSGVRYGAGESLTIGNADIRLYAQWAANGENAGSASSSGSSTQPGSSSTPAASSGSSSSSSSSSGGIIVVPPVQPPLAGGNSQWALVNLITTVGGLLLAAVLLVSGIMKKRTEDDTAEFSEKGMLWRILAGGVSIIALLVFILTENINTNMVVVDGWTIFMMLFLAIEILFAVLSTRKKNNDAEDGNFQNGHIYKKSNA